MSSTPRTDAEVIRFTDGAEVVDSEYARTLERTLRLVRELAAAALDHVHSRNSASLSAIWRAANETLGRQS